LYKNEEQQLLKQENYHQLQVLQMLYVIMFMIGFMVTSLGMQFQWL